MSIELVKFQVYGKVQGVFFRKYTQAEAQKLGVTGWCENTEDGEGVMGEIEGDRGAIFQMRNWLAKKGSPKSKIQKIEFSQEGNLEKRKYAGFEIRK